MKPTSKELLKKVSKYCSNQLTLYKFNTSTLKIQQHFHEQLLKQMQTYSCLDENEYKHRLYDALNNVLDEIIL